MNPALPTAPGRCPAAASSLRLAVKSGEHLIGQRCVEILPDPDTALHEAQLDAPARRLDRPELRQRPAGLGNRNRLTVAGGLDQFRQAGLGFVEIDLHEGPRL